MISEKTKLKMRLVKLGKSHNHKTSNGKHWKISLEGMENRRKSFNSKVLENLNPYNRIGTEAWNKGLPNPIVAQRNKEIRFIGENHWNWQGGKTPINRRIRISAEYKQWRESIFKRDDWTCQECGCKWKYLHPHHVKPFAYFPELRFDPKNGITLCVDCHTKTDTYLRRVVI